MSGTQEQGSPMSDDRDSTPYRRTQTRSARRAPRRAVSGDRATSPRIRPLAAVAVVLVVLALAGIGIGWNLLYRPATNLPAGEPVAVSIPAGSSTVAIAGILAQAGVVDNALMFRLQSRLADADGKLRAGEYDLATGMPYDLAIAALTAGPPLETVSVPIPEGFTVKQIAARFAERAGIPYEELLALVTSGAPEFAAEHPYLADAFHNSLEGFLFPATYEVKEGATARDVVEMMLDHFDAQIAGVDLSFAGSRGLGLTEVVIIASVLEREAQRPEEFPLVSSVIYNRLAIPMRLQLCATVLYTMEEGKTSVTEADTRVESPYNTYLHDGLPVGPISNPGMAALTAAANPADTKYLYYVLTGADGSQTFTETYAEFLKAKAASPFVGGN